MFSCCRRQPCDLDPPEVRMRQFAPGTPARSMLAAHACLLACLLVLLLLMVAMGAETTDRPRPGVAEHIPDSSPPQPEG